MQQEGMGRLFALDKMRKVRSRNTTSRLKRRWELTRASKRYLEPGCTYL